MLVLSTGQIAKRVGEDRDAVSYAIRKAGIQPVGRAGLVRLFPQSAVDTVRTFLAGKRKSSYPPNHPQEITT
jgi:hypothetical protein